MPWIAVTQSIMRLCTVSGREKNAIKPIMVYLNTRNSLQDSTNFFIKDTFFFIAILDGIFFALTVFPTKQCAEIFLLFHSFN
jgi:hypothetical protein